MLPEWTIIGVCLVFTLTVEAFKAIETELSLLCFKTREVDLEVCFAVLGKVTMMFSLVWTTAFSTSRFLNSAEESGIFSLSTVLALRNTWVHVCTMNSSYVWANVEWPVNEFLDIRPVLNISYIYLDNGHIWLWRCLYNVWVWYKADIVKNMHQLNNLFN